MIRVIACGKMREKWMKDGASEYLKRIGAYDKTEVIEVQDEKHLRTILQQITAKLWRSKGSAF
jgi:23S rRNA pseudoU1915 N3-methylase RlmH